MGEKTLFTRHQEVCDEVLERDVSVWLGREGSGKSKLALHLAHNRAKNVIFLCHSNEQCRKQAESFASGEKKASVQLVVGRTEKMKLAGLPVVWKSDGELFGSMEFDGEKTLDALKDPLGDYKMSKEEALELIDEFEGDKFDLSGDVQIIVATSAQIWQVQGKDLDNWVIMLDDPDRQHVNSVMRVDKKVYDSIEDPSMRKTCVFSKKQEYFAIRPADKAITWNIKIPMLVTTTEELVARMVKKNLGGDVIDDRAKQEAGHIVLFCTDATRKTDDWLIPYFARYMEEKVLKEPLVAIGNGIVGMDVTHSTARGSNAWMEHHSIIELSQPDQNVAYPIRAEFAELEDDQDEANRLIMLDQLFQSVGRNQGHRAKFNKSCFIFCDKQHSAYISKKMSEQYKHEYFTKKTRESRIDALKKAQMRDTFEFKYLFEIDKFLSNPHTVAFSESGNKHNDLTRYAKRFKLERSKLIDLTEKLDKHVFSLLSNNPDGVYVRKDLEKYTTAYKRLVIQLQVLVSKGEIKDKK